jgi:hypothetical protein
MNRREDITVREALLEMKIRRLEEELYVLRSQKGVNPHPVFVEEGNDLIVEYDDIFKQRTLNQVVGVDGFMDSGKLKVYAWFQSDAMKSKGEEFRLGYFIDPLIKRNSFSLAQELGEMHYKFVMNIATHFEKRFGATDIKYNNFYSERDQKIEIHND